MAPMGQLGRGENEKNILTSVKVTATDRPKADSIRYQPSKYTSSQSNIMISCRNHTKLLLALDFFTRFITDSIYFFVTENIEQDDFLLFICHTFIYYSLFGTASIARRLVESSRQIARVRLRTRSGNFIRCIQNVYKILGSGFQIQCSNTQKQ